MLISWWEWTILVVTIVVITGLLWAYFGAPNIENYFKNNSNLKKTSLKNFLEKADNGDIILMAGNTRGERACRWASSSIFSHCGMLFREKHPETKEDILYVWEADIGQGSKKGPRIMPVKDKLQRYRGFKILGWKPLDALKRPGLDRILQIVKKHSKKSLDSQMWPWVWGKLGSLTLSRWSKDPQRVFCSELLAMTLQDLEMIPKNRSPYLYSPQDFHRMLSPWSSTVFVHFG